MAMAYHHVYTTLCCVAPPTALMMFKCRASCCTREDMFDIDTRGGMPAETSTAALLSMLAAEEREGARSLYDRCGTAHMSTRELPRMRGIPSPRLPTRPPP